MSLITWSWPGSTIVRVVDGDSIDVLVHRELGFGGTASFVVRLRLARVNTPPIKTDRGKLAAARVIELTTGILLIETLNAYKFGGPDTSPGEWMAEITSSAGQNVSDTLVAEGLAVYWNGQGPRPGG